MGFISIVTVLMSWWLNRKLAISDKMDKALAGKVNISVCAPAMRRVGGQIDELQKSNATQNVDIRGLEVGMAFIVDRMGGNFELMKKNNGDRHG